MPPYRNLKSLLGAMILAWVPAMLAAQTAIPVPKHAKTRPASLAPCDAVAISGHVACLGQGSDFTLIDLFDPSRPRFLGSLPLSFSRIKAITVRGGFALAELERGDFSIIDLRNPAKPKQAFLYAPNDLPRRVAIEGTRIYCADGNGLKIIDWSNPERPVIQGKWRDRQNPLNSF